MKLINKIKQFLREREHAHWLHGRMLWRHRSGAELYLEYRCSKCNHYYLWSTPYCPHCGAKMDEESMPNIVTNNDNAITTETRGEIMPDSMMFPKTVDEFMEEYKIVDSDEVYTNGTELVPIFRMKQWFEHEDAEPKHAYVIIDEDGNMECSNCGSSFCFDNYCAHCGAKLIGERKGEVEDAD